VTRSRAIALAVLTLLVGGWVVAAPASAADDGQLTWGVAPADGKQGDDRPNFVYDAEPGDVIHDGIVVTNLGSDPLTLRVYAADALTTSSGQLDLLPSGQPSVDVGTWVALEDDTVEVPGGGSTTVPFTVSVPDDATPGDHSGGVVTSYVSDAGGAPVALDSRLGSRMHIRVAGELNPAVTVSAASVTYHGTANPFAAGSATVTYTVTNTGNTRVTGTDQVRVSGPSGMLRTAPAGGALPELLPGSALVRHVEVPGVWPTVRVSADVQVLAEGVGIGGRPVPAVSAAATGWAVPWVLAALVVIVVIGAFALPAWRDRRSSAAGTSPASSDPDGALSVR